MPNSYAHSKQAYSKVKLGQNLPTTSLCFPSAKILINTKISKLKQITQKENKKAVITNKVVTSVCAHIC